MKNREARTTTTGLHMKKNWEQLHCLRCNWAGQ